VTPRALALCLPAVQISQAGSGAFWAVPASRAAMRALDLPAEYR
jgi:hypothetical protein